MKVVGIKSRYKYLPKNSKIFSYRQIKFKLLDEELNIHRERKIKKMVRRRKQ